MSCFIPVVLVRCSAAVVGPAVARATSWLERVPSSREESGSPGHQGESEGGGGGEPGELRRSLPEFTDEDPTFQASLSN